MPAPAPTPAKPPVWSRDYAFGRDDTNPGIALPPPNITPWLAPAKVNEVNTANRNAYIDAVGAQYRPGWIGDRMLLANLASTPELGNIGLRSGQDWSGQRTSGTRFDAANAALHPAPDPSLIGAGGYYGSTMPGAVPAGMKVNPFYALPGQEPFITEEAYDALFAPGGVLDTRPSDFDINEETGMMVARPRPDAYDATLLTPGNKDYAGGNAPGGYDPGAPWQRENDYYAALKMRNDLGNATAAGYVMRQNPDGTYQVSGLTTPNAQGQWIPDARANVNDVNIRSTYNLGAPPTKALQGGQDALQYLMSQEIDPSQPRFMPGYTGAGAKPVIAPFGATGMKWPGVDVPLGGQTYEEAIAAGRTDPTLAGLYAGQDALNNPPFPVPGGTGAAGLAAGPAPAPAPAPTPRATQSPPVSPDVQVAAGVANADGYYMGIPLADWRMALDDLAPDERDAYLAANPLLAEKLLRGYASGGVWNMNDPAMVGENGPEILSPTSGGNVRVTPMSRYKMPTGGRGVPNTAPGIPEDQVTHFPTPALAPTPWWERDWPSGRGGGSGNGDGSGGGPTPMPDNPWDGKAIQMPVDFWGKTALDRQAYFEGLAGSDYNPEYLAQLAEKYRLAGTSGYNRRAGY